jgi:hypothetical protein
VESPPLGAVTACRVDPAEDLAGQPHLAHPRSPAYCDVAPSQNPLRGAWNKLAAMSAKLRFAGGESMQSHPTQIVRADETDAGAIITILSTGFQNDPVSRWLFPDDDARERLHPKFFGPFVKMALEDGEIYTTEDRSGAALWFPVTAHHEDQPGLGELYEPKIGSGLPGPSLIRQR